jgi:hypothetical protein
VDRLILDTGVLVAAVRGRATVPDDANIAIPAIVIAEYLAGVHLDHDAGRQAAQRAFLDEVLASIFTSDLDPHLGEEYVDCRDKGGERGSATWATYTTSSSLRESADSRAAELSVITTAFCSAGRCAKQPPAS